MTAGPWEAYQDKNEEKGPWQDYVSYPQELKEEMKETGRSLAKEVARFGAEIAGIAGGAIKGGAMGAGFGPFGVPVGAAIGAGIGYGAVRTGEKLAEGERLTGTGLLRDIGAGAAMEATGRGMARGLARISGKLGGRTDPALARLYEKFEIKPLPSEALAAPSKTFAIMESVLGYSPASGTIMTDYAVTRLHHLNNIRAKLASRGASESELNKIGNAIRDEASTIVQRYRKDKSQDIVKMVDDMMNQMGVRGETKYFSSTVLKDQLAMNLQNRKDKISEMYGSVDDVLGLAKREKIELSKETQDAATELYKTELSKPAAFRNRKLLAKLNAFMPREKAPEGVKIGGYVYSTEEIAQMPEKMRKALGLEIEKVAPKYRWEGLKGARSALNEEVAKIYRETGGKGNNEARIYKILADSIDDEMERFAASKGDDVWNVYKQARAESRTMHELFDKDVLGIMNAKPQEILQRVVARNDVQLIQQIKETLGPSAIEPLKKAYFGEAFNNALKETTLKSGERYLTLDTKSLQRSIDRLSPEMIKEVASPEEIAKIGKIIERSDLINLRAFGRGKREALQFLDAVVGTSNEKVVDFLFKPENVKNIKLAKRLISQQEMRNVQEAALNKVLQTTPEGNFLPVRTAQTIRKYVVPLRELIGKEATADIMDFVKVTGNMKKVEQMAQNASQTGQVFVGYQVMQQLLNAPLQAMKSIGTPWAVAKIYTSDVARNYLRKALQYPANHPEAISNFTKSLMVAFEIGVREEVNR